MATTEKKTMTEFANECEYPVLFWVSIGTPMGDYAPLGYPDWSLPWDGAWEDLNGTVDADGDWNWDGEGHPTDFNRNSVTRLSAYSDKTKWERLVGDDESED